MQARPALTCLFALLGACGGSAPSRTPLHYPALPKGTSATKAAFAPSAELAPLALACRPDEPTLANALDDDCDGRIDGAPAEAALVVALAYPRTAALELALASEGGRVTLTPETCGATQAFCTIRIGTDQLARGRHTLLVRAAEGTAPDARASLVVSVQGSGKVTSYIVELGALDRAERALGQIALP